MPEGDTIFRAAATLRTWIGGRVVTAARCDVAGIDLSALVGRVVSAVTPVGKHLLMQFDHLADDSPPLLLRTHMRMSGSWHVYAGGARWQRPARQARVVIQAGDRLAVCFNVPIVELTTESVATARGVAHLGPDILGSGFDAGVVAQLATSKALSVAIGEALLDQRIVAGIGNIYRCESMYLQHVHPWTTVAELSAVDMIELLLCAERLMKRNLDSSRTARDLEAGADNTSVYRRAGLPCRSCGSLVLSRPQGDQARMAYWCPVCQPAR